MPLKIISLKIVSKSIVFLKGIFFETNPTYHNPNINKHKNEFKTGYRIQRKKCRSQTQYL